MPGNFAVGIYLFTLSLVSSEDFREIENQILPTLSNQESRLDDYLEYKSSHTAIEDLVQLVYSSQPQIREHSGHISRSMSPSPCKLAVLH